MKRILYGIIAGNISFGLLGAARTLGFDMITEKFAIFVSAIFAGGAMAGGALYD